MRFTRAISTRKQLKQLFAIKGLRYSCHCIRRPTGGRTATKSYHCHCFPATSLSGRRLQRRYHIVITPGVYSFVASAGEPITIPDQEIDAIRRAVEGGSDLEPHPFLTSGDWVRIKRGPLEGVEGILVRKKNRCRLVLSVKMLEQAASVEVDGCLVERLNRNRSSASSSEPTVVIPAHLQLRAATPTQT